MSVNNCFHLRYFWKFFSHKKSDYRKPKCQWNYVIPQMIILVNHILVHRFLSIPKCGTNFGKKSENVSKPLKRSFLNSEEGVLRSIHAKISLNSIQMKFGLVSLTTWFIPNLQKLGFCFGYELILVVASCNWQ